MVALHTQLKVWSRVQRSTGHRIPFSYHTVSNHFLYIWYRTTRLSYRILPKKINMLNIVNIFPDNIIIQHYIQGTMCPVWPSSPTPQLQLKIVQNDVPGDGLLPVKLNNISLTYWVNIYFTVTHADAGVPTNIHTCAWVWQLHIYVHININAWIWYKIINTYFEKKATQWKRILHSLLTFKFRNWNYLHHERPFFLIEVIVDMRMYWDRYITCEIPGWYVTHIIT